MACIGLIGGLGVGATVHYYEKIAAACKARGVSPDLLMAHADVDHGQNLVRAGRLDELARYLCGFIDRMARAGATAAAIPAVTPHICIDAVKQRATIPVIDIVETIAQEMQARGLRRVALLGTVFTMEGSLWGQLTGVEIVKPLPDEIAFVGKAYQRILDTQVADLEDAEGIRRIAIDLQRREGVEVLLLAGTDLTVMFDEQTAGFPAIDVARLHIDAIVARLCS